MASRDFFPVNVRLRAITNLHCQSPICAFIHQSVGKRSVRLSVDTVPAMFYTHALFQSLSGGRLNGTSSLLTYIMINSVVPL